MDRLRPDDHFFVLLESDTTPMHIGSYLTLAVPAALSPADAIERLRVHLLDRLAQTPLLRVLRRSPLGFDSDWWCPVDIAAVDLDRHLRVHHQPGGFSDEDLRGFIARTVMERLDLTYPPFAIDLFADVDGGRLGAYIRIHHAVADGIGFQTILGLLSDEADASPDDRASARAGQDAPSNSADQPHSGDSPTRRDTVGSSGEERLDRHGSLRASLARFRSSESARQRHRRDRSEAGSLLREERFQRPPTPQTILSGPTSSSRRYATVTVPFDRFKATANALDATVNDLYLAVVGSALRTYLLELGELPASPLTTNSSRSYRRPEHGPFGNRIVAIHPHLATHLADPIHRLRAIQESMAFERTRTELDEAMLDAPESPFGPATRRWRFANRHAAGGSILPGNVSVSNVPGPSHQRSYAGFVQLTNHPAPLLGSGRAMNFTVRRNANAFDVGIMVDPAKAIDPAEVAEAFLDAVKIHEALANEHDSAPPS